MNKEEQQVRKRLIELSNLSFRRNITAYSDFLNLNELNILHTTPKNMFPVPYETFGGYHSAERQMVSFLPDALYLSEKPDHYPVVPVQIRPLQKKFSESLTHRDYLGAILNLGVERNKIGDIIFLEDEVVAFIHQHLAEYICEHLQRIRHTSVISETLPLKEFHYAPRYQEIKGSVASVRLDTLLALAFPQSRSKLTGLISSAKVYVNGRLITSNGYHVKDGDIISVRQMGKFAYKGLLSETKKGRYYVIIHKYI